VKFGTVVVCSKCKQPIASGQGFGYVCFKIPGEEVCKPSFEDVLREIAPGRNRLLYLWGHLTATHDAMLPLLGLGERLHPEFDAAFISTPDKSKADIPSHEQVRRHGTSSMPNCGRGLKKSRGPTGWRGTLPYRKKISPKTLAQSRQKKAARRAISQQFGNSVPAPRNRNQAHPKVSITGEKCACREYNTRSRVLCAVVDRVAEPERD